MATPQYSNGDIKYNLFTEDSRPITAPGVVLTNSAGAVVAQGATNASRIPSAAASTNATVAKNAPGTLFTVTGYNAAAAARYIKFYNLASAPTVGTTPVVLTFAVPATAAFAIDVPRFAFSTGIAYALTTGAADSDTGALTSGDILGLNVMYA